MQSLPTNLTAAHDLIQQLRDKNAQLENLARIDPVTSISNRRAFDERLLAAFATARRSSTPLSVVVFDLDNFKRRNDALGHLAGDYCLSAFAAQLVEHCRPGDTVARIGGEEFAIVLPDATDEDAAQLCRRIADRVRYGCCAGEPLTFSAGVAMMDSTMLHPSTILDNADKAMYAAKHNGKDKVCIHAPAFHRAVVDGGLFQRISRYLSL
jgi:diguanylate cyclase (GGDEF)-like protein